jgi:hypothetical protein
MDATETFSLHLNRNARTRWDEERLAADIVLLAISAACDVEPPSRIELFSEEHLERTRTAATDDWRDLLVGKVDAVLAKGCELNSDDNAGHGTGAVFPGAFAPLHHGHRGMAQVAAQLLGRPVEFEISIDNVDKPPLNYTDISERLTQFGDDEAVWLTRAATFVEKAQIFPDTTFVVGVDTVTRIGDAKYYASPEACRAAWSELERLDCRFLVFGRVVEGRFQALDDLSLPEPLRRLCQTVPGELFRDDVSSTELRRHLEGQAHETD